MILKKSSIAGDMIGLTGNSQQSLPRPQVAKEYGQRIAPFENADACILLLLIREIPPTGDYGGKVVLRSEKYLPCLVNLF